jgi:hypothetical protein
MTKPGLAAPVLFLVFNRPDVTRRVFEEIRRARPAGLYVAADGPRTDRPGEAELCRETRELIKVDWECDLHTLFRDENLGVRAGVSSALSWFFENVAEGIVLEDDTLPEPSFFGFASELLDRYRDDPRVMHISGDNFQFGRRRGKAGYYFSRYVHGWGWATWRRAWAHYDLDMASFPRFVSEGRIEDIIPDKRMQRYWMRVFGDAYEGRHNTWDYSWAYAVLARRGLCAVPNVNLVTNIGFGRTATHTFADSSRFANIPTARLGPLTHPPVVAADDKADEYEDKHVFLAPLRRRLADRLKLTLGHRP